jgi:uncharacterized protein YbbC (DUF1343 family)
MSKNPPLQDQLCYGVDLRNEPLTHQFTLSYVIDALKKSGKGELFFKGYFNSLAGTDELKKQLLEGKTEIEIKNSWVAELTEYKKKRSNYLIYEE